MRFICFLSVLTFLLTGCKKPSGGDDPEPETACRIDKTSYSDGTYNSYRFDAGGKLTSSTLTYLDENDKIVEIPVTYEYNTAGNLVKSKTPDGWTDEYTYDATGALTKVEFKNEQGQVEERFTVTTDAQKRITQIKNTEDFIGTYTYDNNGNVTKVEVTWNNFIIDRSTYEYDQSSTAQAPISAVKGHPFHPSNFTSDIIYSNPLNLTGGGKRPVKGKYETQYNEDWTGAGNTIRTYVDYTSVFKVNSQNFIVEESATDRISSVTNTIKYTYSNCN